MVKIYWSALLSPHLSRQNGHVSISASRSRRESARERWKVRLPAPQRHMVGPTLSLLIPLLRSPSPGCSLSAFYRHSNFYCRSSSILPTATEGAAVREASSSAAQAERSSAVRARKVSRTWAAACGGADAPRGATRPRHARRHGWQGGPTCGPAGRACSAARAQAGPATSRPCRRRRRWSYRSRRGREPPHQRTQP